MVVGDYGGPYLYGAGLVCRRASGLFYFATTHLLRTLMPTPVPIEIFRIGRTAVDKAEVRRWLDFIGAAEFVIPEDEAITNPALLIALAGKRCYKSFTAGLNPNVTKIRKDYTEYFDNILASGHGSVLEHSVYTFAIENISRVFSGEMNRHRAGWAISEGSMRFIRYGKDIPYWEPESIKGPDVLPAADLDYLHGNDLEEIGIGGDCLTLATLDAKKQATRELFQIAFRKQEHAYRLMEAIWADELKPDSKFRGKKEITSMMRRIVGMGVATGGVWTGNIRALRHVIAMRASPQAEEEILHVFSRIAKMMRDDEPLLFGDFEQDDAGFWRPRYVKV